MTKFYELSDGEMFTFHSFSNEVWKKVGEQKCICLSYADSELDEPLSVKDNVFPVKYMENPQDIYGNVKGTEYPVSMFQGVERVKREQPIGVGLLDNLESTDKFQPLAIMNRLRECMKEVSENTQLSEEKKEGIRIGLAWTYAEISTMAVAKDRFTPKGV